jgi:hypothetical protein
MNYSLRVKISKNNHAEKTYIIKTLFDEFLNISTNIEIVEDGCHYIIYGKNKKLVIRDDFFSRFQFPLDYLKIENLPISPVWFTKFQIDHQNIPIIYGQNLLEESNDEVICGLDIFASSFFMLTRWEEAIIEKKDELGRCDEKSMFVVKHNLYHRPIVNEYIVLLKYLLKKIDIIIPAGPRKYEVHLTHDIDYLFRFNNLIQLLRNLGGDLILRKSLNVFYKTLVNYYLFKINKIKDPRDTIDELMNLSDIYGLKSHFYFKSSIPGEVDCTYNIFDPRIKVFIQKIIEKKHFVGFHPSLNTFQNPKQFRKELNNFQTLGVMPCEGRQHCLKYDIPNQLKIWEDNHMVIDTGLGFSQIAGFRCGICWEYNYFDIYNRIRFDLKIRPLIVMDVALLRQKKLTQKNIEQKILQLAETVKSYHGIFVFLWHNDSYNPLYSKLYEKCLNNIR